MRVTTAFNKMLGLARRLGRRRHLHPRGHRGGAAASTGPSTAARAGGRPGRSTTARCAAGATSTSAPPGASSRPRSPGSTAGAASRVRTEEVPWARPGARHTRDLQDVVAWLAQRTDKTTITKLLRITWEAVAKIVVDVVAEAIDDTRLNDLYRIGVDEVSYRKGHRYLTVVADHDREGAVVWVGEGKDHTVLEAFYDELGAERSARLEAVSLDMGGAYKLATDTKAAHVTQCVDPFHLVKLANDALDATRREVWNQFRTLEHPRAAVVEAHPLGAAEGPGDLTDTQLEVLHELRRRSSVLYRGWQLKEARPGPLPAALADPGPRASRLVAVLGSRCRIPAFVKLPRPCGPTASASSPPSSSVCRTRSSRGSTRRSASSTTAATATTPPPRSSP